MPRCQLCQGTFEARKPARFCSSRCRSAAWQQAKAKAQADRDGRVRLLLVEALRELAGKE